MPIVSSATPASGPTGGATLVTVSGSKLDLGDRPAPPHRRTAAAARARHAPRRRAASPLPARRLALRATGCSHTPLRIPCGLHSSLRRHRLRCRFGHELREETAAGCAPHSAEFSNVDSDCRYGDQVVNATFANFEPLTLTWWERGPVYGGDAATTNVSCLSPPRADARSLALEVSLNGQQYTIDTFGYVRLARLEPLARQRHQTNWPHRDDPYTFVNMCM